MQFSIIEGSQRETKIQLLKISRKLTKQTLVGGDQLSRFKFHQPVTDPALTCSYVIEPQVLEVELDWFAIFVLEPVTLVNSRNHKQIRGVKLFISQNMDSPFHPQHGHKLFHKLWDRSGISSMVSFWSHRSSFKAAGISVTYKVSCSSRVTPTMEESGVPHASQGGVWRAKS